MVLGMRTLPGFVAGTCLLGAVRITWAHGLGGHYDLPVPFWFYLAGAVACVACCFGMVGALEHGTTGQHDYPRVNLLRLWVGCVLTHPILLTSLQLVSAGLFVLLILTGLLGQQNPAKNLAPTFVWSIGWVGLAYVSALGGNLWALVNPWKVLFEWVEALYRRITPGSALSRYWLYPRALGAWPGVLLLLVFAWVELVLQGAAVPANLAGMILLYSGLTWTGMFLFGTHVWLRYGEVFSIVFGLLARFAPTEVRVCDPHLCQTCRLACRDRDGACIDCYACFARAAVSQREWNLRPYAVGLARNIDVSLADMACVLVLLATVTFDGVLATPLWADIEHTLRAVLPPWGSVRRLMPRTLGLLGCVLLLFEIYVLCSVLMAFASGKRSSGAMLARYFACTLVPIAIAYHIAHYLAFLLVQGQALLPLLSDPFGFGWNLLGTVTYTINSEIVGAQFAWYTMVIALGIGYSTAVFLAHRIALRTLRYPTLARRSQYPMLALMVSYSMVSLWILAQPIIGADEDVAPTTVRSTGPCQGFAVLPNGYAVLSGLSTAAQQAHRQSGETGVSGKDHLMGYHHGQEVTLRQGMLCVPIRDSQTTAWVASSQEAGLSVIVNAPNGILTPGAGHHASFDITLWDTRHGIPVDDATVRLVARMPHHDHQTPGGHGLASDPDVHGLLASPTGRGRYTIADARFQHAWRLACRGPHAAGQPDAARLLCSNGERLIAEKAALAVSAMPTPAPLRSPGWKSAEPGSVSSYRSW